MRVFTKPEIFTGNLYGDVCAFFVLPETWEPENWQEFAAMTEIMLAFAELGRKNSKLLEAMMARMNDEH